MNNSFKVYNLMLEHKYRPYTSYNFSSVLSFFRLILWTLLCAKHMSLINVGRELNPHWTSSAMLFLHFTDHLCTYIINKIFDPDQLSFPSRFGWFQSWLKYSARLKQRTELCEEKCFEFWMLNAFYHESIRTVSKNIQVET